MFLPFTAMVKSVVDCTFCLTAPAAFAVCPAHVTQFELRPNCADDAWSRLRGAFRCPKLTWLSFHERLYWFEQDSFFHSTSCFSAQLLQHTSVARWNSVIILPSPNLQEFQPGCVSPTSFHRKQLPQVPPPSSMRGFATLSSPSFLHVSFPQLRGTGCESEGVEY